MIGRNKLIKISVRLFRAIGLNFKITAFRFLIQYILAYNKLSRFSQLFCIYSLKGNSLVRDGMTNKCSICAFYS